MSNALNRKEAGIRRAEVFQLVGGRGEIGAL
jgi:hypothetical protein